MAKTVLFDLGDTLVHYYRREEFPYLLERGLAGVAGRLAKDGAAPSPDSATVRQRAAEENHEAPDHRVRPLEGRLARIFAVEVSRALGLCPDFMAPIFGAARVFPETVPVLRELRARGIRTAVVSNSPWGSPADLWRGELRRLGLAPLLDAAVFCGDVGWRKPDPRIFRYAIDRLQVPPSDVLYVGDDPRWDRPDPATLGLRSILVERGSYVADGGPSIPDLSGVLRLI